MVAQAYSTIRMWRLRALSTLGPSWWGPEFDGLSRKGPFLEIAMTSPARKAAPQRRSVTQPVAPVPPVDLARLRRFTLANVELEREIIGLFAVQAPIMMDALVTARTDNEWRDATHTLKGSSASIGAWLVADAAARAETVTKKPTEWQAARHDMASAMHASLTYLAQIQASNDMKNGAMAAAE
jgi:HPt (histidine-containing phosphotransfer) domain-containing protein